MSTLSTVAVCLLFTFGAGTGSSSGLGGGDDDVEDRRRLLNDEHDRMVVLLHELELESLASNPYFGSKNLVDARTTLRNRGPDVEPLLEARMFYRLGVLELRAGEFERAIAALGNAYEIVEHFDGRPYPKLWTNIAYHLGIAHLRLGETQNCVALHTSQSCIFPIAGKGVHSNPKGARAALSYLKKIASSSDVEEARRLCSRWLVNVAAMAVGEYPEGVPAELRIERERYRSDTDFPTFTDIAPELGINAIDLSGGALAEDFDGDGRLDLITSSWDRGSPMHFYRRTPSGGFEDRTNAAGLRGFPGGLNMVQADYDDDGDVDVLVLRGAWQGLDRTPNSLLQNQGEGRFRDQTFSAGLGARHYPTQAAAWSDYDNDGDLDLYVANEASTRDRYPSQLFRNTGLGSFVEVAGKAGVENMRFGKSVAWGDYDTDGFSDLYVSNLRGWNRLYRNGRDGTFVDVAAEAGVQGPFESFVSWFWDYDNDGQLDLFVATFHQGSGDAFRLEPTVRSYLGMDARVDGCALYRGDGQGGFQDRAVALGLDRPHTIVMGANFGDLDNDGFLDVYLGTGYPHFDGLVPNVMFRNAAGEHFEDVTVAGGFGHLQKGHAVVFADLDSDGDQDVYQQLGGAFPGDTFGNALFENPGTKGHWIVVETRGERSNHFGLGARITVALGEGASARTIHRTVSTGGSFGANPHAQHIGLGSAVRVRELTVEWPASGLVQRFKDLPVDGIIRVREGSPDPELRAADPLPFRP